MQVLGAVGPNYERNRKRKLRRWLLETAIELGERPPPIKMRKLRFAVVIPSTSSLTSPTFSLPSPSENSSVPSSSPEVQPELLNQVAEPEDVVPQDPDNAAWSLITQMSSVSLQGEKPLPYDPEDPYEFYQPEEDKVNRRTRNKNRKRVTPKWELMERFGPEDPEPFNLSYIARPVVQPHDLVPAPTPDVVQDKPSSSLADYKIPKIKRFRLPSSVISPAEKNQKRKNSMK